MAGECAIGEDGAGIRAINRATLRLDWVLGDDPSQVAIPGSPPPRAGTPVFDIPSTVPELPEFGLGTIQEQDEAPSARSRVTTAQPIIGTWPRVRRLFSDGGARENPERNISLESFISGSTSNGIDSGKSSSETIESNFPRRAQQTVTQGTQTESSTMTVHATVQEGR